MIPVHHTYSLEIFLRNNQGSVLFDILSVLLLDLIDINAKDETSELVNSFKLMIKRIKTTMTSRDNLIKEIDRREQLEKANLLKASTLRKQKLESIGVLAGGVAHEINNPLNGILNYSQLISDIVNNENVNCEDSRSDIDEFSAQIIMETNRASTIVKNSLQFSQHEEITISKANIYNIIEETLSLTNILLKHDQIDLEVDVQENIQLIECVPQQLQQVIMNVLYNARDALNSKYPSYDDSKRIELKVRSNEQGIILTIKDYGSGIPIGVKDKIFDPFFTTKGRLNGTGLGLSISYGIVKEHNGTMSVESVEGSYTKVKIYLPFTQP